MVTRYMSPGNVGCRAISSSSALKSTVSGTVALYTMLMNRFTRDKDWYFLDGTVVEWASTCPRVRAAARGARSPERMRFKPACAGSSLFNLALSMQQTGVSSRPFATCINCRPSERMMLRRTTSVTRSMLPALSTIKVLAPSSSSRSRLSYQEPRRHQA